MPTLPAAAPAHESIINVSGKENTQEEVGVVGGKWENEEERRFFEDIQDLRDFVPKSILGLDEPTGESNEEGEGNKDRGDDKNALKEMEEREAQELESELKRLELKDTREEPQVTTNGDTHGEDIVEDE